MRIIAPALIFAVVAILVSLSGCSVGYVTRAGWEETKILWRRQALPKLIENKNTPADLRQKFELVLQAREFAKKIGLKPGGSFSSYSVVDDSAVTWVITAAPRFELTPKTWWFPFVGSIPYKGFFDVEDAKQAATKLKEDGFDVHLRGSTAFSTLGWFNDPLLSTTAKLDEIQLVETVIHELLHNTIWVPGDVAFNETLANLVGSYGAIEFFSELDGPDGARTVKAREQFSKELVYSCALENLHEQLTGYYAEPSPTLEGKSVIIHDWMEALPVSLAELKAKLLKNIEQFNNATIIGEIIYRYRLSRLMDQLTVANFDLQRLIDEIKQNPRKFLEKITSKEYRYTDEAVACMN